MSDEELQIYRLHVGSGPLIATAVHDGHDIRPDLLQFVGLPEADRLREEDPFTGLWTTAAPTRVVATRSRFEVDLNRPRETCAYREPADCWGLRLYSKTPPAAQFERSLAEYDDFYGGMHDLLTDVAREHKRFVVYDMHSYNHRREGPDGPEADAETNPQVNVGTESIDRKRWGGVVDAFTGLPTVVRLPRRSPRRTRERQVQRGQLAPMDKCELPRFGCRNRDRIQEVFHGRMVG